MIHYIKLNKAFCGAVMSGAKPFEIRRNDRGYQTGDLIKFTSVDDVLNKVHHPIDEEIFKITYVLSGWGLQEGFVALGIERQKRHSKGEIENNHTDWENECLNG